MCGGCGASGILIDVFAAGGDEAEEGDVDVADDRDDEGVVDADVVGDVALQDGDDGAADDGLRR